MTKALSGLRVLDFSWSVAGPTVTRILASMGAEVIKVEWPAHADPMRTAMFANDVEPTIDSGSFFAGLSTGKESLTLNAGSAAGFKVVEKLIRECDIVVESFSAKMLRRWGLDYERMAGIHPGVIYLSISGFGHGGPYETFDTWGPTAQAFAGLTATSGLPGLPPAGWGYSYMDICAGYLGAVSALSAIHARKTTGVGQYIDISQAEAGIGLTGPAILDAQANDRPQSRPGFPPGNSSQWPGLTDSPGYRGEVGAPYGLYPTLDAESQEAYCAITVLTDAQWQSLCTVLGNPRWTAKPEFQTSTGRLAHQFEIDALLSEWTRTRTKHSIMRELQAAGVPAGAVQNARELLDVDPTLTDRRVFQSMNHPILGDRRFEGVPICLSKTPIEYKQIWPVLSSGNDRILREVAKLSDEEIEELNTSNVLWPADLPRDIPVQRPLW